VQATLQVREKADPVLRLSWLGSEGRLLTATLDPDTAAILHEPAPWHERATPPLLAWRAAPRAPRARSPIIQYLIPHTDPEGHLVPEVWALSGDGASGSVRFPRLPPALEAAGGQALRWFLPHRLSRRPVIAASRGGSTWWVSGGAGSQWQPLPAEGVDIDTLQLWSARDSHVHAAWQDVAGYEFVRLLD
jgi:hypothetical protein